MKSISVVIPSSGNQSYVELLLQSMQEHLATYSLEIVIVCNPTNLAFNEITEKFKSLNLKIFQTDTIGVNFARQLGLDRTTQNLVLFLDDDCQFTTVRQLDDLYHEIVQSPQLFAVGGHYKMSDSDLNPIARAYAQNQMNWLKQGRVDTSQRLSAYLIGGFFIMNKAIANRENLRFDTTMIFGGTEKDFFLRAYSLNLPMRLLDVSIQHYYPNVRLPFVMKVYKQGRGLRYMHDKGLKFEPKYLDFSVKNLWLILFDIIFWAGYFLSKNEYVKYFRYLYKLITDNINEKKLMLLNKLKKYL